MSLDAFEQVRDLCGTLPSKSVTLEEGMSTCLHFRLCSAAEIDGRVFPCSLEDLAAAGLGGASRENILELASKTGPLFGRSARESLESWQLAVHAAQLAMTIKGVLSAMDEKKALQDSEIAHLEARVSKHRAMVEPSRRNGCTWTSAWIATSAGDGEDYMQALPQRPWVRQLGPRRWAVAQPAQIPNGPLALDVGVAEFTFDACRADLSCCLNALRSEGLPQAACINAESEDKPVIASSDEIHVEKMSLSKDDAEVFAQLLSTLAQVHALGARMDIIRSTAEQQFLAFPSLLSYLWFDFVRRSGQIRVGFCPACGKPFSKAGKGGARKRFCGSSCRAAYGAARRREAAELKKNRE